jgi:hypothetical protein
LIVQSIQHALHCASRIPCANIRRDLVVGLTENEQDL